MVLEQYLGVFEGHQIGQREKLSCHKIVTVQLSQLDAMELGYPFRAVHI